jgi:hypothetical protein
MTNETTKELARLSLESGIAVKDIEAQLKQLMNGGLDEEGAMAVWKSDNNGKLGGRIIKDALIRVVGKTSKRERQNDDGTTVNVASFNAFVVDGEQLVFTNFGMWREKADIVESMDVGALYKADVKVKDANGEKKGIMLSELTEASKEENNAIPSAQDLVKKCQVESLAKVADYIGSNAFFQGIVGKIIQDKAGTKFYGVELSSSASNPVAVFINDFDPHSVKRGQRLLVYGYVASNAKGISIRASGVFPQ